MLGKSQRLLANLTPVAMSMLSAQILVSKQMPIKESLECLEKWLMSEALKVQGEPEVSSVRRQLSAQRLQREC